MNERIKLLAEQASLYARSDNSSMLFENYHNRYTDKFAELIIKECISIVDEQKECLCEEQQYWSDHDYGYEMAVNDASMGIKQFFGVEK